MKEGARAFSLGLALAASTAACDKTKAAPGNDAASSGETDAASSGVVQGSCNIRSKQGVCVVAQGEAVAKVKAECHEGGEYPGVWSDGATCPTGAADGTLGGCKPEPNMTTWYYTMAGSPDLTVEWMKKTCEDSGAVYLPPPEGQPTYTPPPSTPPSGVGSCDLREAQSESGPQGFCAQYLSGSGAELASYQEQCGKDDGKWFDGACSPFGAIAICKVANANYEYWYYSDGKVCSTPEACKAACPEPNTLTLPDGTPVSNPQPVTGSCDYTSTQTPYCLEYIGLPGSCVDPKLCSEGVWSDGPCTRTSSVGGCGSPAGTECSSVQWFYEGGPYTSSDVMSNCSGDGKSVYHEP